MSYTLKIKIHDTSLYELYTNHKPAYIDDAGIDIYVPNNIIVPAKSRGFKIPLHISTELVDNNQINKSYFIVPRSSISKTPLRLSHQIGIIDAGYRGKLDLIVDNISSFDFFITKYQKFIQICAPDLQPIKVCVTNELSYGSRGCNGLGSSDKLSKL